MAEGFSPERILQLKRAIHDHLQQSGAYSQIRELLADYAAQEGDFVDRSPDAILSLIEERGLLNKVLQSFDVPKPHDSIRSVQSLTNRKTGGSTSGRYLHLQILGGRAFLDNLDVDTRVASQYRLYCQIHFGTQRFRSGMVECVCEPPFDDDFVINLDNEMTSRKLRDSIALNIPLHILVLRYDTTSGTSTYVGENTVEWRKVLSCGKISFSVELGSGSGMGVAVGIVNVDLSFLGPVTSSYSEEDVAQYLATERSNVTASEREFVLYSKRWWNEFQSLNPNHSSRKVKVFVGVGSNTGIQMVPITTLVHPLQSGRLLSTPFEAARFVSLISSTQDSSTQRTTETNLAGGDNTVTMSQLAYLCTRQGDVHNNCILLCSLFLGFGLDAYCVTGTKHDTGPHTHMWVMTRSTTGIIFWDATAGTHSMYRQGGKSPVYTAIWSVFNHSAFYANANDDDSIESCRFEFNSDSMWKPMNPMKLKLVSPHVVVPLLAPTLSAYDVELKFEEGMMGTITEHRLRLGLPVSWDSDGSYILTQSLSAYEQSRLSGDAVPALQQDMFQHAIRMRIPDGHTFKGFPVSCSHSSPSRLMQQLVQNPTGKDILECVGDDVHFMLRCKVFVYPEDVLSVWVMIAVRYRPTGLQRK
eukprot:PhF_6_TR29304/c0_g1_i1/m.42969/K16457/CEP76; centrosomal protein CEP76